MVSKEQFIRNTMVKFCKYVNVEFEEHKELVKDLDRFKNIDVLMLLIWWFDTIKTIDNFISLISEKYSITFTDEQTTKISKYLEVLYI